jgi:SAM-dependent methyltransferase
VSERNGEELAKVYHKKDFWIEENQKYARPHFRMEKASRILNRIANGRSCDLLDVGCGPATLERLLHANINYYGIDIAIHDPAPNLMEVDIVQNPIMFDQMTFDIVVAQGLFEYLGNRQDEKFAEIAEIVRPKGTFLASYVNFGHRSREVYWPYSNVQPIADFRKSLARKFVIRRWFPTSHNWAHSEPNRAFVKVPNMYFNARIPFLTPWLAVEFFFVCTPRAA